MRTELLVSALALSLTACATEWKPQSPPATKLCQQPKTDKIVAPPMSSVQEWVEKGPLWAVDVLETLRLERQYRAIENKCHTGELP